MNSCPYCNAPVTADKFICDACSDPSQTVKRMDREQAAIDVKALPEGMEDLSTPDLEKTAKAKIASDEPSLAEEVAATGTGVIEEVQNFVVEYQSGTDYVDLEPATSAQGSQDHVYKSTTYESKTYQTSEAAPVAGAVATKPKRPPSGAVESGNASASISSSFNSKGVATLGEPDKAPQKAAPAASPKSTTPYITVDQRPAGIEKRVGSSVSREKWQEQKVHADFQFVKTGTASALLIILPIIFFMPIIFSSIPGFIISIIAIGFFVNLAKKLHANVVDTEWNKFASWVYEKKAPDRREVFLSFVQPPYIFNHLILMDKSEDDRTPILGLKLHVKKNNMNHEIWQGMERFYAGDTKYAANIYMDHSDDLEVVVVEIGKARFWCEPEVDH